MVFGEPFVVADASSVSGDPGQGPFNNPAAGQDMEACGVIGAFDDGQGQAQGLAGPDDELSGVSAVGPDQADPLTEPVQDGQEGLGPVPVLGAGPGDQHAQQQPHGVDRDVAFAAVDLLARVIAAASCSNGFRRADRGRIDDRGSGFGLTVRGQPNPGPQGGQDRLGG